MRRLRVGWVEDEARRVDLLVRQLSPVELGEERLEPLRVLVEDRQTAALRSVLPSHDYLPRRMRRSGSGCRRGSGGTPRDPAHVGCGLPRDSGFHSNLPSGDGQPCMAPSFLDEDGTQRGGSIPGNTMGAMLGDSIP